jgi:uncharacterized protein YneF (UPF0154 family)
MNAEIKKCEKFIKDNFINIPSVNQVMIKSLFFCGGTFTNEIIIKQALKNIKNN